MRRDGFLFKTRGFTADESAVRLQIIIVARPVHYRNTIETVLTFLFGRNGVIFPKSFGP